jgi:hypothetical protein
MCVGRTLNELKQRHVQDKSWTPNASGVLAKRVYFPMLELFYTGGEIFESLFRHPF